jgi:hypothetical protein
VCYWLDTNLFFVFLVAQSVNAWFWYGMLEWLVLVMLQEKFVDVVGGIICSEMGDIKGLVSSVNKSLLVRIGNLNSFLKDSFLNCCTCFSLCLLVNQMSC